MHRNSITFLHRPMHRQQVEVMLHGGPNGPSAGGSDRDAAGDAPALRGHELPGGLRPFPGTRILLASWLAVRRRTAPAVLPQGQLPLDGNPRPPPRTSVSPGAPRRRPGSARTSRCAPPSGRPSRARAAPGTPVMAAAPSFSKAFTVGPGPAKGIAPTRRWRPPIPQGRPTTRPGRLSPPPGQGVGLQPFPPPLQGLAALVPEAVVGDVPGLPGVRIHGLPPGRGCGPGSARTRPAPPRPGTPSAAGGCGRFSGGRRSPRPQRNDEAPGWRPPGGPARRDPP